MYQINTFMKHVEEDHWEKGCIGPGSEVQCGIDMRAATIPQLLEQVRQFFGVDSDALLLDSCEEIGRIDVCVTENEDGNQPSTPEMDAWKAGKGRMWYAVYTGYVYECKPVSVAS